MKWDYHFNIKNFGSFPWHLLSLSIYRINLHFISEQQTIEIIVSLCIDSKYFTMSTHLFEIHSFKLSLRIAESLFPRRDFLVMRHCCCRAYQIFIANSFSGIDDMMWFLYDDGKTHRPFYIHSALKQENKRV